MRRTLLVTLLLLGWAGPAFAQAPSRVTVGPVAQIAHASFDGDTGGTLTVAGVAAGVRISRALAIEGELTTPGGQIARSYEGTFVSYIPSAVANPSRAEIERWAPIARRTLAFDSGLGGAAMLVARTAVRPRVTLAGRVGVSARRYVERSTYVVLTIPEGVDPARVARDFEPQAIERVRGGLLVGGGADLAVTTRLTVAPQVRFIYSGPSRFGDTYRELGLAVGARWLF